MADRGNKPSRVFEDDNISAPPHSREGQPQIVTSDTARQAPGGRRVLIVLVTSLFVILALWALGGVAGWW